MRKPVWMILGALILGASTTWGGEAGVCDIPPCDQAIPEFCSPCDAISCNPCDAISCNPCDAVSYGCNASGLQRTDDGYTLRVGRGRHAMTFDFGGWVEAGVYTNGNGRGDNGPMHVDSTRRTDFLMDQLYLFGEKKMNSENGFDWGARIDFYYGVDAPGTQSFGDESFDYEWGQNDDGYALSMYQLYGTLGYKKLSVKYGKFATPIGWEAVMAKDNFFYSHSYCYWIEPGTHVGALADYALTDRLTISGGWTAGHENGFVNHFNDHAVLAGLTYSLTDKATIYYWMNAGHEQNELNRGAWAWGDDLRRNEYFIQSLCFEWMPTDRFTYVMQYNLRNDNLIEHKGTGAGGRLSTYGINNHLLYKLNDKWGVGMRVEWLRDNGGYIVEEDGDYWEITLGINWKPINRLSIRPEIRFDWVGAGKAVPYADFTEKDQVSGGVGMVYVF